MKRVVTLMLALALMMGMTAFTPNRSEASEVVVLDMFLDFSWLPDSYVNLQGTRIGDAVTAKTGVALNITRAKTGDGEQINLLLASGDLPDMVCVDYAAPIFATLRESDYVMDLKPLMDEYAPELYENMGEGYWNFYTNDSGVNNYFANCAFSPISGLKYAAFGPWCNVLCVRTDIYEAMGSPSLSNEDELIAHLEAVREAYPDVKTFLASTASSLALTGRYSGLNWWKSSYGIETYYEEEDGSVVAAYNHPDYGKAITLINELYRRDFITREDLAGTDDTINAQRQQGSVYMFVGGAADLQYPPAGNPDVSYMAAPVFDTFLATQQGGIHWCATFITTNCKDPAAAIRLTSYLASTEGDRLNQWGVEGEDYELDENGAPVRTQWYYDQVAENTTEYGNARGNFLFSMNWADHEWVTLNVPNEEPWWHQARVQMQDHYFCRMNYLSLDPTGNSLESIILQQCNDAWNEAIPSIIMAESSQEALDLFGALIDNLESLGIGDVEEAWTAKSNRIKEAFGADNMVLWGADSVVFHNKFD